MTVTVPQLWIPTSQPPLGSQITYGHPLARGLMFYALPGGHHYDLVSKSMPSNSVSVTNYSTAGRWGPAVIDQIWYPFTAQLLNGLTNNNQLTMLITVRVITYFSSGNESIFRLVYYTTGGSTAPNDIFGLLRNGTNTSTNFHAALGGTLLTTSSATGMYFNDSQYHTLVVTRNGATINFYIDGKFNSVANIGSAAVFDTSHQAVGAAKGIIVEGSTTAHTAILALWNRVFSAQEVLDISTEPYQILMSPNRQDISTFLIGAVISGATPKTITDSATGSETISLATITPSVTDSATGTDAPTLATITPSTTDSAAGSETTSFATITPQPIDSATGSDTVSTPVSFSLSDGATLTDSVSVVIAPSITDSATGNDAISVGITLSTITDSATGTETPTILITNTTTDSASGSDAPSVTTTFTQADAAVAGETLAMGTVTFPLTDAALAAESLSVQISTIQIPADGATGSESMQTAASFSLVDNGTGAELASIAVQPFAITDTVSGTETLFIFRAFSVTDTATLTDTITVRPPAPTEYYKIAMIAPSGSVFFEASNGKIALMGPDGTIFFTVG